MNKLTLDLFNAVVVPDLFNTIAVPDINKLQVYVTELKVASTKLANATQNFINVLPPKF